MKQVVIQYRELEDKLATDVLEVEDKEIARVSATLSYPRDITFLMVMLANGNAVCYHIKHIVAVAIMEPKENETTVSKGKGKKSTEAGGKKDT